MANVPLRLSNGVSSRPIPFPPAASSSAASCFRTLIEVSAP
jgi:hypothetical protein